MTTALVRCLRICGVHLQQADFAARLGYSTETVKDWERPSGTKKPSGPALVELAKVACGVGWNPQRCTGVCK